MHQPDEGKPTSMTLGCKVCSGILRHEEWCYVKPAAINVPEYLSDGDNLILHALGAKWSEDVQLVDKE